MQSTFASKVVAVVVATNIAFVFTASLIHFANAQEPEETNLPNRVPPAEFSSNSAVLPEQSDPTVDTVPPPLDDEAPPVSDADETHLESGSDANAGQGLADLQIPDSLPDVAPPDATTLRNDPIFKEFQKMFETQEDSQPAISQSAITMGNAGQRVDTESLIDRLESAEKLTQQAKRLATESKKIRKQGLEEQADALARLAYQVSEVAAEILSVTQ